MTAPLAAAAPGDAAAAWCLRLAAGPLPPAERATLEAWLAADARHAAALDSALDTWAALAAASVTPEVITLRADALEGLRRANRRRWSRPLVRFRAPVLAAAATLALAVGLSADRLHHRPLTFATGLAERRSVILADGSQLSLDARSRVDVDLSDDRRALVLTAGRAKFDVAHDRARPFTVVAGDRTIIATGTSFSVELLEGQVHVIVYDGRVAVARGTGFDAAELRRMRDTGSQATALTRARELVADAATAAPPSVAAADVTRSLAWQDGQLDFADEPLREAAERLNRYAAVQIEVADDAAAVPVNGVFNTGDTAAFVDAVAIGYPIVAQRRGDHIVLARRPSCAGHEKSMCG